MGQDEGPDLITMFALMQLLALPPEERKAQVEDGKPASIAGILQAERRVDDERGINQRWLLHLTPEWNGHSYLGVSCLKKAGNADWVWYAALVHADADAGCEDALMCPMTDLTASVYNGKSATEPTLAELLPKVGVQLAHPEDEVIRDAGLRLN